MTQELNSTSHYEFHLGSQKQVALSRFDVYYLFVLILTSLKSSWILKNHERTFVFIYVEWLSTDEQLTQLSITMLICHQRFQHENLRARFKSGLSFKI